MLSRRREDQSGGDDHAQLNYFFCTLVPGTTGTPECISMWYVVCMVDDVRTGRRKVICLIVLPELQLNIISLFPGGILKCTYRFVNYSTGI